MIGIDILENERMREKVTNPEFVQMFLTENEQKYVSTFADMTERVTGLFCAKEAVKKAFDCPSEMGYKQLEIGHYENGKPYVSFDRSLMNIVKDYAVEISISHSKTVTVAVCLAMDLFSEDDCGCDDCGCGECDCDGCECEDDECDCHDCDCEDCKCEDCDCEDCDCEDCDCEDCDCEDCDCEDCDCGECDCEDCDCDDCNCKKEHKHPSEKK